MIDRVLIIIFCICFFSNVKAQLEVSSIDSIGNQVETLENLIVSDLFGCDVEVFNIEYTGHNEAIGTFNYIQNENSCPGAFGLDRGLIMTTGMIEHAVGPNNDGDDGEAWNVEYVDDFIHNYLVDFEVISPSVNLYDACVLEFDVTSSMLTSIDFEVIFGSEEYPEWMSPYYADAFCFFISEINGDIDPNFNSTPKNIMETGDIINNFDCNEIENKPISPWTIRPYSEVFNVPGVNECLYVDNQNGEFCDAIGYDGYTEPMLFNFTLLPEATYHIKMIILDGVANYWAGLDSGVFIKSIPGETNLDVDFTWGDLDYNNSGTTISFNNISASNFDVDYFWDFNNDGDIDSYDINPNYTFEAPGNYIVTLQVMNNCTGLIDSISYEIIVPGIGLDDVNNSIFSIFPNPTYEKLHIRLADSFNYYLIEIIDVSGRIVKSISNYSDVIYTSDIHQGVYYINIKNELNQSLYIEKLIVF